MPDDLASRPSPPGQGPASGQGPPSGRSPPSGLKGWLSDVYYPALVERSLEGLGLRLGDRAAIDDPLLGRASGMAAVTAHLAETAKWLTKHEARYERTGQVVGTDRDVTEGVLAMHIDSRSVLLPVAVVAERRKEREVELRIYFATRVVRPDAPLRRRPVVAENEELSLPQMVVGHLGALRSGDIDALLACFETTGVVRDAKGIEHRKEGGGLRVFYEQRYGVGHGGGAYRAKGGSADDGRCCAVEFTLEQAGGRPIEPRPGLAVYELGESGLLRSLRLYEEPD